MASDSRAAKRHAATRSRSGTGAKKSASTKKTRPAIGRPGAKPKLKDGVFLAIIRTEDGTGGIANIIPLPQGDVRPAEMLHITEKAVGIIRGS